MRTIQFTPPRRKAGFRSPGYWVWCPSIIKGDDGLYHLFCMRMPNTIPFHPGWVTSSEIIHATAETAEGPYEFADVALRTRKLRARLEVQPELELLSFHVHLALHDLPPAPESKRHSKKSVCIHIRNYLHRSRQLRQHFLRCPQDSLFQIPPERLPRRAVRGLGAHSPHQTGSFHPCKTTKCPKISTHT